MKSILRSIPLLIVLVLCVVSAAPEDLAKTKVLYTVGYAHLDTEWRWDYPTTINEYIWNTMAFNFRLFEKYPHYVFNFSGANRYKMMKEYYPAEFERVKRYAAAGRWFPSGSSMEENDVLAASHESIIRQILLGNHWFRRELGTASEEYMLPDCFGFPASLPSILAHCGLKGFSTQKLPWGSAVGIPFNVGRWIGPDGESVVAALNPGDYTGRIAGDLNGNDRWMNRVREAEQKSGVGADYMYYGTGDVGGSPTEDSVRWLETSIANGKDVKIVSAAADQMFKDITPGMKAKLPAYTGEFLLTNHSAGSITSAAFQKRLNRKNEILAYDAEAAASIGTWLGGMNYDRDKINEAWRLVMGGQFHDILPGTSIPRAYEFAWNDELLAANQLANVLTDAVGATARALDTRVQGVPLVVFNPLSFEREDAVEASVAFPGAAPQAVRVYDRAGRETPSQVIKRDGSKASIVFMAKVPSVGYAVFDVRPADTPCSLATGLKATPSVLENGRYIVKLDAAGDIAGIRDKAAGKELLAAPIRLAFQHERPQDWPAWNQDWADRQKPPAGYVDGPAKITVIENGPARVAVAVEREARHSKFVQIIRLTAGGERVEFDTHIDWATAESSLKASFPLTVSNPKATYTFGVGTVQRGNNDPLKFEVPSHRWFDLTHADGSYGVSVLDDCKYGSDKPADNAVRLTLLYTPGVRGSYREQRVQDFGKHDILYALYGHRGDWRAGDSALQAARLNQPLLAFQSVPHAGTLGRAISFLAIDNRDVALSALKKAEDGDELIVRVVESKGKAAKGIRMAFPVPIVAAREVDGQERELGPASVIGGKLVFDITPYHLRTFALKLNAAPAAMAPPLCAPVALPYNADVISGDAHKADGDFNGRGQSYPAEMLPDAIMSEAVAFRLGPKADGADNAVACAGQTIALPEGNFNKLYILAAADEPAESRGSGASNKAVFKIGPASFEIPVQVWSGFLGQWDRRMWWEGGRPSLTAADLDTAEFAGLAPGYLRTDNVAFFTTHRHLRNGENEAYAYAYIYKYKIDLPAGAGEVVLPVNGRVKILAMTAARNENDAVSTARPLFDTLERDRADYARFRAVIRPQIWPDKSFIEAGKPILITMMVRDADAEIHYTLDGSAPSPESPRYEAPIRLDRSAVVKAVAFDKVRLPSAPAVAYFSRSLPVKTIQYLVPPLTGRGGREGRAGNSTLIDLVRAEDPADSGWQMFDKNLEVVLDLGENRALTELILGVLENHAGRVFGPAAVEISVSADNKDFKTVAARSYAVPEEARPAGAQELRFDLSGVEGRYVRVLAKTIGALPKWHSRAGLSALMEFDEIMIR